MMQPVHTPVGVEEFPWTDVIFGNGGGLPEAVYVTTVGVNG
jgi:hypothetical protein